MDLLVFLGEWILTRELNAFADYIFIHGNYQYKDIRQRWCQALNAAVRSVYTTQMTCEWDSDAFLKYLSVHIDDINEENLLKKYFDEELNCQVNQRVMRDINDAFRNEVINDEKLALYCLIHKMEGLKNMIRNEYSEKDFDEIMEVIRNSIDRVREGDMYAEQFDDIYQYLCDHLVDGCNENIIDAAYFLADIYDHISEYEKSINLAESIAKAISPINHTFSAHHLRQYIGCVSSNVMARIDDLTEKERMLDISERNLETAKKYIDGWNFVNESEKLFVESLYESNYAAIWTNRADISKKRDANSDVTESLEKALEHHKKAECLREKLVSIFNTNDEVKTVEEAKRYLYQSKSNIAGILYRLQEYEEALNSHTEVLEYRLSADEITTAFQSKSYIVGCYIGLLERSITNGSKEKDEEISKYADECVDFYMNCDDEIRHKEAVEKREKLELLLRQKEMKGYSNE